MSDEDSWSQCRESCPSSIASTSPSRQTGSKRPNCEPQKDRSLRITSIPQTVTENDLRAFLQDLEPSQSEQKSKILSMSFAPHFRSWLVATVCFDCEPLEISKCAPGKEIDLNYQHHGTEHRLVVDCDFYGMTTLYCPENPVADIIAVTGLAGHALGSWKSPGRRDVWLRDFLPGDLPRCRILTYGYISNVQSSIHQCNIQDYGSQFLEAVNNIRDKATNRPIIFVGHSLGGLIITQALLDAAQINADGVNKNIVACTSGVFLFGVPLGGLHHEELLQIAKDKRNFRLISDLMADASILQALVRNFQLSCMNLCALTVSFYETKETHITIINDDGSIGRGSDTKLMVTQNSATALSSEPNKIPMEGDHSTMVKFRDATQDTYQTVVRRLERAISVKTIEDLPEQSIKTRRNFRDWLKATNPSSEYETHLRHHAKGTCSWILDRKEYNRLVSSEQSNGNILWISGKPGAGKSVISAFIINNLQLLCKPLPNTISPKIAVLYFFFRSADPTKSSSPEMLASIIDQILEYPFDRTTTMKIIREGEILQNRERSDPCRSIKKLWDTLQAMLQHINKNQTTVVIVVDALDECNDRQDFMNCLATSNQIGARFLITSRPENDIIDAFHNRSKFFSVVMDVDDDINTLVQEVISSYKPLQGFSTQIINTIKEKAEGMFRYVALMLDELQQPQSRKVRAVLQSMPRGLYGMYERILAQLHSNDGLRSLRKLVLLSITIAYRPMTVAEVSYAYVAQAMHDDDEFDPMDYVPITVGHIRSACGSLVEVTKQQELRFTHSSVKEFLLQSPSELSSGSEPVRGYLVNSEMAHITMASSCVTQLSLAALDMQKKGHSSHDHGEPLRYAMIFWLLHASEVAKQHISAVEREKLWEKISQFLISKAFSEWKLQFPNYNKWHRGYCMYDASFNPHPITVAASYGLTFYFDNPKIQDDINTADSIGRTALSWAAINGNGSIVKSLLTRRHIKANKKSITGCTPLHYASAKDQKEIMEQLLGMAEVDVNTKDCLEMTPLCVAVELQNTRAIQVLLNNNGDTNIVYSVSGFIPNLADVIGMEALFTANTLSIP